MNPFNEATVTVTLPDGSYYKMGCAIGEAVLAIIAIGKTLDMPVVIYNSDGERLGEGTHLKGM